MVEVGVGVVVGVVVGVGVEVTVEVVVVVGVAVGVAVEVVVVVGVGVAVGVAVEVEVEVLLITELWGGQVMRIGVSRSACFAPPLTRGKMMCAETDKDYMRVAMMIENNIHQTYEFSDEAIRNATERQIQKNLAERSKEDEIRMTHNADDAYFDRMYEGNETPLRDLLQNNPDDWDNFLNGHLGAYIDFQNWLRDQYFNKKDEVLVRIVDRAIEELEHEY